MMNSIYKALLYKDYKLMKTQGKSVIFIMVLLIGINIFGKNYAMLALFLNVLPMTVVLSSIGGDDLARFYPYAFSTPITREILVKSKFLITGIVLAFTSLSIIVVMKLLFKVSFNQFMAIAIIPALAMIIMTATTIPLVYKFGITQGRYILMVLFFVVFSGGSFLLSEVPSDELLNSLSINLVAAILFFISIVIVWLSYKVSVKILSNKEF